MIKVFLAVMAAGLLGMALFAAFAAWFGSAAPWLFVLWCAAMALGFWARARARSE